MGFKRVRWSKRTLSEEGNGLDWGFVRWLKCYREILNSEDLRALKNLISLFLPDFSVNITHNSVLEGPDPDSRWEVLADHSDILTKSREEAFLEGSRAGIPIELVGGRALR